jgi:NTE family protein
MDDIIFNQKILDIMNILNDIPNEDDLLLGINDMCNNLENILVRNVQSVLPGNDISEKYYDTLVLSGASIKGFITLGALQYLYDISALKNIKTYVGTSSGSIISYLLIIGYTPIEILTYICTNQILEKMKNFNLSDMLNGKGACSFDIIQSHLEKMTISKIGYFPTLNDLYKNNGITLICSTYNFTENRGEYLSWETHPFLPCLTALRMSSNLPLIFEPYKYSNNLYVDGYISDNFPIEIGIKSSMKTR